MLATEHGEGITELVSARHALETFVRTGDVPGQLATHSCLSVLLQAIGGYDEARRHAEAILALATRTGRRREVVVAHNNLTWHEIRVGELRAAALRLETVVRLAGDAGDARLQALALANVAELARLDGRHAAAIDTARRALGLLAGLGDPGHRVRAQGTIGLALAESGQFDEAEAVAKVLAEVGPAADGTRAMICGYVALGRGERDEAAGFFESAAGALLGRHDARDVVEALVGVAVSTGDPAHRGSVLVQLEDVCQRGGLVLLPRDRALLGEP
jgi:tetratricopeptide (TPR) repeat protein